jgi:drug/metabolite transporter (DMT)-like permease
MSSDMTASTKDWKKGSNMLSIMVMLAISVTCAAAAPIVQAKGMIALGAHDDWMSFETIRYFWKALTTPAIIIGTALHAVAFFLNLALLARAPVSFIVPMAALEYFVAVLLARMVLGETVEPLRWGGVALIMAGVVMLSMTWKPE